MRLLDMTTQKTGISMGNPLSAQKRKGRMRQGNAAILGSLALAYMNHHAITVDIGDFQMQTLLQRALTGALQNLQSNSSPNTYDDRGWLLTRK